MISENITTSGPLKATSAPQHITAAQKEQKTKSVNTTEAFFAVLLWNEVVRQRVSEDGMCLHTNCFPFPKKRSLKLKVLIGYVS